MSKAATYIIGEPGVGKSTLVEWITEGHNPDTTDSPFSFRRYDNGVTELGKRRADFSGTDALSMSVQPTVQKYIEAVSPALVLAEGDRLANRKFFDFLKEQGYEVYVYAIVGSKTAARQREERGSRQDDTWLRGRQTKVHNLIDGDTIILEAGMPPDYYRELMMDPITRAFWS